MKKILYVVTEDWYFWSHRLSLAEAAQRQGYEVHVVTRPGEYAKQIAAKGFIFHPLFMNRGIGSLLDEIGTFFRLYRYYRELAPDLVHHIALKPVLMGSCAATIARIPAVINSYTGLGFLFISDSRFASIFRKFILPLISPILRSKRFYSIVQNQDDLSLLEKSGLIEPARTVLIPGSGVDTNLYTCSKEYETDKPVVLFASRLLRDKGIHEFIEAVRLLRNRNISARFVVAGDTDSGNPTSIRNSEVIEWVNQGLIEWWGYRDDMHYVLRESHIVCLPSCREGLPKILIEASASGRAIITTDVPGCREAVREGVNGLRVPVKDVVRLAAAIERLLSDSELRISMGEQGRKMVEELFDMEKVNSATLDLYGKLS